MTFSLAHTLGGIHTIFLRIINNVARLGQQPAAPLNMAGNSGYEAATGKRYTRPSVFSLDSA
jgi:hypothetical protein